ncbi:MAG: tetratricopeptide repeat protein [Microcoleaceae cyanobacterium]
MASDTSIDKLLQQSFILLNQGDTDQAFTICQQILRAVPEFAPAYQLLGNIYEARQQWTETMHAYVRAMELQPTWAEPYLYLARLYRNVGWLDEAITFYQKALKLHPQPPQELYYALGEALSQKGEYTQAIHFYRQAIALNPQYVRAYLGWAVVLNQQGQNDEAITVLEKLIRRMPGAVEAYNTLGCLLLKQGQLAKAQAMFQEGLQQRPSWALLYNNLGRVFMAQSKTAQAIAAYQKAVELKPDLAIAYNNLAKLWQEQNQHRVAIDYFHRVIELKPDDILAHSDCANSWMMQGKMAEALRDLQTAISLDPKFVDAFCELNAQIYSTGITDEVLADELQLAQISCTQFLNLLRHSDFDNNLENIQELESHLRHSRAGRNPADPSTRPHPEHSLQVTNSIVQLCQLLGETYLHLGNTLARYEEFDQAIRYYQIALQAQPQQLQLYWRLSYCLLRKKRWNSALVVAHLGRDLAMKDSSNLAEKSSEQYIENQAEIDLVLGLILEKQQRQTLAVQYYETVFQQLPAITIHPLALSWITARPDYDPDWKPLKTCALTQTWLRAEGLAETHYFPLQFLEDTEAIPFVAAQFSQTETSDSELECQGLDCHICLPNIFKQLQLANLGHGIQTFPRPARPLNLGFSHFVARIPQGRTWIVPQENPWMVCKAIALITPDQQLLADVSREYPGELPGCRQPRARPHRIFDQEQLPPRKQVTGTVAVLSGLSGNIYFHWMVDVLPRIELIHRSGMNLDHIDWFLVNNYHLDFQEATLKQLGIPKDRILASDEFPHLEADELIVPSFAGPLGWSQPWAIDFLRRTFLTPVNLNSGKFPARIYISRQDARHRRVLNEAEVLEVLSQHGFVCYHLAELSFAEQVSLFHQAEIVIAPHGSGLTNIVFCEPKTKVVELISPHYHRHYYWVISQSLQLDHYALTGEGFACYPLRNLMYQNPLTEDIWVNLTSLRILLGKIGII